MKKKKHKWHKSEHGVELSDDINVIPILDAMVGLVIFLLFAVSSVTMKKLDIHSLGAQQMSDQDLKDQQDIKVPVLKISENNTFTWNDETIVGVEQLYTKALELKVKQPFNFQVRVTSSPEVDFDYVAGILSKLRSLQEPFVAKNSKGEEVTMSLLFPDAILEGV